MRLVDVNYNFEYDWLIELRLSDNKLLNDKLSNNTTWQVNLVEYRSFFYTNHNQRNHKFYDW